MRVAPNFQLNVPKYCLNPDPTKNMFSFRQPGGGHGSCYPHKECVTTHRPNENVSKMDGAKGNFKLILKNEKELDKIVFHL